MTLPTSMRTAFRLTITGAVIAHATAERSPQASRRVAEVYGHMSPRPGGNLSGWHRVGESARASRSFRSVAHYIQELAARHQRYICIPRTVPFVAFDRYR